MTQGATRISKQGFMPSGKTPPLRLLTNVPRQRAPFHPAPRRAAIGQLIQVTPQVDAPINIGLGSAPMVIGSFVGAAAAVAIGAGVPEIRTFTTIAALALGGFGVYNLVKKSQGTVEGGGELPGAVSTPGGGAGASAAIATSPEQLVAAISGRVISPTEWQVIDISPFTDEISVRVRLTNPSPQGVTFDLMLVVNEIPQLTSGIPLGDEQTNTTSSRVSLGGGETRDIDLPVKLVAWGFGANYMDVYMTVQKRTIAGGQPTLVDSRAFVID